MSLDISLIGEPSEHKCQCDTCGNVHTDTYSDTLFSANITHNLGEMAKEAGVYQTLWRPEELGFTKAGELIPQLTMGLNKLINDRYYYEQFNPSNGWGSYDNLVSVVANYLTACNLYPDSTIKADR